MFQLNLFIIFGGQQLPPGLRRHGRKNWGPSALGGLTGHGLKARSFHKLQIGSKNDKNNSAVCPGPGIPP